MNSELQKAVLPAAEECQTVSTNLITHYGWQLLVPDVLAMRMQAQWDGATPLRTTALQIYSLTLHQALLGPPTAFACRQACEDIYRYLYTVAIHRWGTPAYATEVAQDALGLIWQQRLHCREPSAFLKFCLTRLLNAHSTQTRGEAKHLLQPLPPADPTTEAQSELIDTHAPAPENSVICQELWGAWLTRFGELHRTRAARQLDMVYYKYFLGLSDEEIIDQFAQEIKLDNLQALRAKGIRRLKEDPTLAQLTHQLLESCS